MLNFIKPYPAIFEKTDDNEFGVFFPDVLGCISAGATFEDLTITSGLTVGKNITVTGRLRKLFTKELENELASKELNSVMNNLIKEIR
jgi:hypothetical protein